MGYKNILTVAVEDYFQATAVGKYISQKHWSRFETRIEQNTNLTLELLDKYDIKATFFTLGWIANKIPSLLRLIKSQGHEIAARNYLHQTLSNYLREDFREDVRRSKKEIEDAVGIEVLGFRIAQGHFSLNDLWALELLSEEGFYYDSSFYPRFRSIVSEPWRRFPHVIHTLTGEIIEMPISSVGTDQFLLPAAGGNYFRQLPCVAPHLILKQWTTTYKSPFNMYFHVWELDPELPHISAANWIAKLRMYRNVSRIRQTYETLFSKYKFESIADILELKQPGADKESCENNGDSTKHINVKGEKSRSKMFIETLNTINGDQGDFTIFGAKGKEQITVIVPCYNEELVLPYLRNVLEEVEKLLEEKYEIFYVFVDDCSTDKTFDTLNRIFNDPKVHTIIQHSINKGVSGSIISGIKEASTEIVCSIDCDCTYDPNQLQILLEMLDEDTAMVTASPYHLLGQVLNVPKWRLCLSYSLSKIYQAVLKQKFATYTSCFRVYRRSKVIDIKPKNHNFLGILEMLVLLDFKGEKIVEAPAVLEVRLFGVSKMKTIANIVGHLKLLFSVLLLKYFNNKNRWDI